MLFHYYLRRFNRELGRDVRQVSPEAMERLRMYAWPGNVRELQSIVKQALLHASGSYVLIPAFLPELSSDGSQTVATGSTDAEPAFHLEEFIRQRLKAGSADLHAETLAEVDRILFQAALRFTDGNRNKAAKVLGLARQTLRLRLRELGITVFKTVGEDDDDLE